MKFLKVFLLLQVLLLSLTAFSLNYDQIKEAYQKSYLYEKIGNYKDAIRVLMPVYEAYPNGYTVNLRLGWLYYLWGKYKNSEFHYTKAVKAIPSSVEAKLGLTLPLMAQEKWAHAERVIYQILTVDYYNYYGNLRLCFVLEKEKKYNLQKQVALKMLSVYPTSVPFLLCLTKSYYHLGDLTKAKNLLKDVLILDPENVEAKMLLQRLEKSEEKTVKGEKKKSG